MRARRRAAGVVLTLAVAVAAHTLPARADGIGTAEQQAQRALAAVQRLQAQADAALGAYQRSLADLGTTVTRSLVAGEAAAAAQQAAEARQAQVDARVRALYMSGGALGLVATVLDAGSFADFSERMTYASSLVHVDSSQVRSAQRTAGQVAAYALTAEQRAQQRVVTVRVVQQAADQVLAALADAQRQLDAADAEVAGLQAAAQAQRMIAADRAALDALAVAALGHVGPAPASPAYMALYHQAAATCPGLSWGVLAAIGQVESDHGRDPSTSYAGAMGPMQFLPATFAQYAVDGDGDGRADIMSPADAIFTAAHYLCANGGASAATLSSAVWNYNHADWYVQLVLTLAREYVAAG